MPVADDEKKDRIGLKYYCANFDASGENLICQVFRTLGMATLQEQRALFNNRASASAIANWKAGRRNVPPWAIAVVRAKAERLTSLVGMMKAGPGSKAGRRNLRRGNYPRG